MNNDVDMIELIRNDDPRAFDLLYKNYWSPLLRFAERYLNDSDTCEEIVQGLFVHLHSKRNTVKISLSVSGYLYTSLRNRIFNYLRNRAVYRKHIMQAMSIISTHHNNVDHAINRAEQQKEFALLIEQMPVKYQEVFLLRSENLTMKKIALLLNRPVHTVEKQMRKATVLMRNSFSRINH